MPPPSALFATALQSHFARESVTVPFTEVEQFRALIRSFTSLRSQFYLEEFHGFKRQIYFNTSQPWLRSRARCELCDLLLVVYSTNGGFEVRMTLLQAKLSRDHHAVGLPAHAGLIEYQEFKANFEQWNLLATRPSLIATTVFDPPSDLLSGALLPSVGTFGVFHNASPSGADLFYIAADCLAPSSVPTAADTRYGKLATTAGVPTRRSFGLWSEVTYAPTLHEFASALYDLSIGTPVISKMPRGSKTEYQPQYDWLRTVLAAHVGESGANAPIARALLADMAGRPNPPVPNRVPSLVVLRSDAVIDRPQG